MVYGCETWILNREVTNKVESDSINDGTMYVWLNQEWQDTYRWIQEKIIKDVARTILEGEYGVWYHPQMV